MHVTISIAFHLIITVSKIVELFNARP